MSKIGILFDLFIGKFFYALKMIAGVLITRILAAFGLSLVTFNSVLPDLKAFVTDYLVQLPPEALNFLSAIGMDVAVSMVLSALTVQLSYKFVILPTSVVDSLRGAP